jgi:hypothetical protein
MAVVATKLEDLFGAGAGAGSGSGSGSLVTWARVTDAVATQRQRLRPWSEFLLAPSRPLSLAEAAARLAHNVRGPSVVRAICAGSPCALDGLACRPPAAAAVF